MQCQLCNPFHSATASNRQETICQLADFMHFTLQTVGCITSNMADNSQETSIEKLYGLVWHHCI